VCFCVCSVWLCLCVCSVCVCVCETEKILQCCLFCTFSVLTVGRRDDVHRLSLPKFYGHFPTLNMGNVTKLKTSSVPMHNLPSNTTICYIRQCYTFQYIYRASFITMHYGQQMHNYFTNYHTATCFDTIVSSSDSL